MKKNGKDIQNIRIIEYFSPIVLLKIICYIFCLTNTCLVFAVIFINTKLQRGVKSFAKLGNRFIFLYDINNELLAKIYSLNAKQLLYCIIVQPESCCDIQHKNNQQHKKNSQLKFLYYNKTYHTAQNINNCIYISYKEMLGGVCDKNINEYKCIKISLNKKLNKYKIKYYITPNIMFKLNHFYIIQNGRVIGEENEIHQGNELKKKYNNFRILCIYFHKNKLLCVNDNGKVEIYQKI